jgi:[ribosomal protein S5]-alanine N-acetyltransferase
MSLATPRTIEHMSLFPTEIESERLRYERLHPDDVDPFELYEYVSAGAPNADEVTAHVTWDPHRQPKETFKWVERCGERFDNGTAATYVLRPRDGKRAGELAGLAGVHPEWERRIATFGTWLRKPFWGRGYSGERAARLLELAFDRLDLEVVAVEHDPENDNSRRAIEKYVDRFGGRREGLIRNALVVGDEPRDSVRYSITREEWERNRE